MTRYKFLRTGFKSENGGTKWKIGQWNKFDGELEMCESGFHCSKRIYQAFSYVQGESRHPQQVAYSTFHDALTQICFGCRVIRSSMIKL